MVSRQAHNLKTPVRIRVPQQYMQQRFDEHNQKEIAAFIIENLSCHTQFSLGTVSQENKPWVVCLNLSYDDRINIIWKSEKISSHSVHIQKNQHVSICIYSSNNGDFGFYANAKAHEVLNENELKHCLEFRFTRKGKEVPRIETFLHDSNYRIYSAELSEVWISDDRHLKTSVDLEILRTVLNQTL